MKVSSYLAVLVGVMVAASSLSAAQFMVGAHAGQALFSKHFDNAFVVGGKLSFTAREGLELATSLDYTDVDIKSDETTAKSFKGTSILGHVNYRFPIKSRIQPYLGGTAGLSFIGDDYDAPSLTYGGTLGFFMNIARDSKLYIEANQLFMDSGDINVDIQPIIIKVGLGVAFGNDKVSQRKGLSERRDGRFNPVRRKPKGPRSRRRR